MTYEEKKEFWDYFSELYSKEIADTAVMINAGDKEFFDYGSFKFDTLLNKINYKTSSLVKENPGIETNGISICLIYLPFSVKPIYVKTTLSGKQIKEANAFGIDLFDTLSNCLVKELKMHITKEFERLAHSNGLTYRTFDHVFYNNWGETLKNN